jgi:hypothetical protein
MNLYVIEEPGHELRWTVMANDPIRGVLLARFARRSDAELYASAPTGETR